MAERVAAASDDVHALLRAYDGLLRWERELPPVVWTRHGRTRLGRRLRVPRVRQPLHWILVDHMERSLRRIRGELDARQMLGVDQQDVADREAIDACLRSLTAIPRKRLSLLVLIAGIGLAHFLARGNDAAKPLGTLTRDIAGLKPDNVVATLGTFDTPTKVAYSVLYLCIAFYLVMLVPVTTFRLKRMMFNLGPERRAELRSESAVENVPLSTGVYELERRVAKRLDARHSLDERPLDLYVSATLVVPALWAIAFLAIDVYGQRDWRHPTFDDLWLAALLAQVLLLPIGRAAWLARIGAMRRRGERPDPPEGLLVPSRRRRYAAGAIDGAAVLVLFLLIGLGIAAAEPTVAVLLAPTLAAAVYCGIALLAGQTFGRRWCGLEVRDRNGGAARPAQLFARDVLLKWGIVNTLGFALLWTHVLVIYLWPLWDAQRRTPYDLLADTVVVRAQPEEATELVPVPSGP